LEKPYGMISTTEATYLADRWGIEGFNRHEEVALHNGYIQRYFPHYLPLKLFLLVERENARTAKERRFFNAVRIYIYTLWENMWLAYITGNSEDQKLIFRLGKEPIHFEFPYWTHLPSFSSVILHLGTCRDLFFILLNLCNEPDSIENEQAVGNLVKVSYPKNKESTFKKDLITFSSNSVDFVEVGVKVFRENVFRNFFAHRMRLLWWNNKKCHPIDRFIKRDVYEAIQRDDFDTYNKHLISVFSDHRSYENSIEHSECNELISAGQILREKHDLISDFLNRSFGIIKSRVQNFEIP
jgi:hypothetical protein